LKVVTSVITDLFKKENNFSLQRFTLIGSTLFLSKIVLILVAYFFDEKDYNTFNKAYYTASILILFGSLGFEYALLRVRVRFSLLLAAVVLNSAVTMGVLILVSGPELNITELLFVYLYSLFACLGGVFTFRFLFSGKYKKYFILMVLNSLFHIAIIPAVKLAGLNIVFCFPFVTGAWFLIVFSQVKRDTKNIAGIKELYSAGVSTFVINSSASFALATDKYIINNFFSLNVANAYTFSWMLTVPLFYIGNLIEKIILASTGSDSPKMIKRSLLFLIVFIMVYVSCVILAIFFFSQLIPASVDADVFRKIFLFMITGYSVYVLFHFPLNGYLFKFFNVGVQKIIAKNFALSISILVIAFVILAGLFGIPDFRFLLFMVWTYIFVLLFIKWRIVNRNKPVEAA
jgi:hypothetical protein